MTPVESRCRVLGRKGLASGETTRYSAPTQKWLGLKLSIVLLVLIRTTHTILRDLTMYASFSTIAAAPARQGLGAAACPPMAGLSSAQGVLTATVELAAALWSGPVLDASAMGTVERGSVELGGSLDLGATSEGYLMGRCERTEISRPDSLQSLAGISPVFGKRTQPEFHSEAQIHTQADRQSNDNRKSRRRSEMAPPQRLSPEMT